MMRALKNLPKHVLISLAVIIATAVIYGILLPTLGGARDEAFADNIKLGSEITRINGVIKQSTADKEYVVENQAQFEALLKSDRLIPHTRRAAIAQLEDAAHVNGLTTMSYDIGLVAANSLAAAASQPTGGETAYRVSVEEIILKIAAPLDGAIYRFLADISDSFPGAAIIQSAALARSGQTVQGEIKLSWRTAQALEKKE